MTKQSCGSQHLSPEFSLATTSELCPQRWLRSSRLGEQARGVLLVIPQNASIREVVEMLILIWADDRGNDWKNLVAKIPL